MFRWLVGATNNEHIFQRQQTKNPLQISTAMNSLQFFPFECERLGKSHSSSGSKASPCQKFMPANERWCACLSNGYMEFFGFTPFIYSPIQAFSLRRCYLFGIEHIFCCNFAIRAEQQQLYAYMRVHAHKNIPWGFSFRYLMEWLYYVNVIIFRIFPCFFSIMKHTHTRIYISYIKIHVEFACFY